MIPEYTAAAQAAAQPWEHTGTRNPAEMSGGTGGTPAPPPSGPVGGIEGRTPQSGRGAYGGPVGYAKGGTVAKRQVGGSNPITGGRKITKPPTIPPVPQMVPMPQTLAARRARPAPGTTGGFKRGGQAHDDVAEDKKLFNKMYAEKEKKEKMRRGGAIKRQGGGPSGGLPSQASPRARLALGDTGGGAPGLPPQASPNATAALAARPSLPDTAMGQRPFRKGGPVMKAGSMSGPGRLAKSAMAAKVPAKTEV